MDPYPCGGPDMGTTSTAAGNASSKRRWGIGGVPVTRSTASDTSPGPGPVLLTAWAGNASEDDQPSIETGRWVHALSLPRALSVRNGRLVQRPVTDLPYDGGQPALVGTVLEPGLHQVTELEGHRSWQLRVDVDEARSSGAWGLRIGTDESHVDIVLDGGALRVDRSTSRYTQHGETRTVTLPEGCTSSLEVIHDRSLTEILVGGGALTFTLRSFVAPDSSGAALIADGPVRLGPVAAVHFD